MSFSTFEISELPDESDNDYALEIQTAESKLGILVSEQEMKMLSEGMRQTLEGDMSDVDGLEASDYDE